MIQLQTLNKIIKDNDMSLITMNGLDSSFFSDYPDEFAYICEFYSEYGKAPDQITFLNKFNDFDIVEVNETHKYLLDELYRDRNMRNMATTFNKVKDLIRDGDIDAAMKVYLQATEEIANSTHMDSVDILADTSRYDDYVERSLDFSKFYISTGFKELDDIIGGWDRSEELATILARPGSGKSFLAIRIAIAAAEQGLRVGFYSGEMSERKVGYRIDTLHGHLSNTMISKGNRAIQNEYKNYIDGLKDAIPGEIHVLTPAMINGAAGVNALRAFIEKDKLDMLIVDQHSLLEDDRNAKDPITRASNISKDLKKLQVMKKIPIIAVSQANRKSIDKDDSGKRKVDLGLENLAQSDRIGQDSTIVIGIEKDKDTMKLHLIKSRETVNGAVLQYHVNLDRGIFMYVPNENDGVTETDYDALEDRFTPSFENGPDEF